jgi:O-antigen/teichoic acid export membrane protein
MLPASFYPTLSSSYKKTVKDFYRLQTYLFRIMFTIGTVTTAFAFVFGREIILVLFGEEYTAAVGILRLLTGIIFLTFLRTSFGYPILAMDLERQRTLSSAAALVVCVATCLTLIPSSGNTGASTALLLSEAVAVAAIMSVFYIRKNVDVATSQ